MSEDRGNDRGGPNRSGAGPPEDGPPEGGPTRDDEAGHPPRQAYDTGPGVGDIFSRPDTKEALKLGVVLYAAVGVGVAVAGILAPLVGGAGGSFVGGIVLLGSLALGPGIGGLLAIRQDENLDDIATTLVYANAATTAAIGTFVLGVIGGLGVTIGSNLAGPSLGGGTGGGMSVGGLAQVFVHLIVVAIGAAVTGALLVWVLRGPLSLSPALAPSGGAQQHQQSRPRQ
jgi:hypothetical protein